MPVRRRITHICRRSGYYDAHEMIEYICGTTDGSDWREAESDAIEQVKANTHTYYVLIDGREAEVIVAHYHGDEYLKTEADAYSPDNLLNLGEAVI